ncbi:MAG: polyprenyl synthetase family protein [Desulfobacteraceae bacterium]|nr:polyprenyl synthetase family protein [Desulfobacteraceae bacterium]
MKELKNKILSSVEQELTAIETALSANLNPNFELVRDVAGHLLFAGGKRLRPLLMMLSAQGCGYNKSGTADIACIFEYLHAATLLHDDVVDGGGLRRGKIAAHHHWDPPTAVLTGDFLLARSLSLAARTGLPEVIQCIADITEKMSQGEIRQMTCKGDIDLSEEVYLDIIECKTAVLFQGACRIGALIANAPHKQVEALTAYGYDLGMGFQMIDDVLDYTRDSGETGKQPGADLREGKLTLPVIHALKQADKKERSKMTAIIQSNDIKTTDFMQLISLLEKTGGIEYTRKCACLCIERAKNAIKLLYAAPEGELLKNIADYALLRGE